MKLFLPIITFTTLLFDSCSHTKPLVGEIGETSNDEPELSLIGGEIAVKLFSQDKSDTLVSSIEYMFYDDTDMPYQDSVNRIIKQYVQGYTSFGGGMTEQNSHLSIAYIDEALQGFADEYKRQLEFYDEGDYFGGIWQTETILSIIDEHPDYVEISFGNWEYSGGAHGNGVSEQRIIDKKTGRELYLVDFISNIDELTSKAETIFRADQEIPEGQSLIDAGYWFEDGIFTLNENFVITDESVSFLFNQYEIAPYAAGVFIIEIPMTGIKHLLKK